MNSLHNAKILIMFALFVFVWSCSAVRTSDMKEFKLHAFMYESNVLVGQKFRIIVPPPQKKDIILCDVDYDDTMLQLKAAWRDADENTYYDFIALDNGQTLLSFKTQQADQQHLGIYREINLLIKNQPKNP